MNLDQTSVIMKYKKTAEATGDLIFNKIAKSYNGKIKKVS